MAKPTIEEKIRESLIRQRAEEAELKAALEKAKKKRQHDERELRHERRVAWGTRLDELGLLDLENTVLEAKLQGLVEGKNNGNSNKRHGIKEMAITGVGEEG